MVETRSRRLVSYTVWVNHFLEAVLTIPVNVSEKYTRSRYLVFFSSFFLRIRYAHVRRLRSAPLYTFNHTNPSYKNEVHIQKQDFSYYVRSIYLGFFFFYFLRTRYAHVPRLPRTYIANCISRYQV